MWETITWLYVNHQSSVVVGVGESLSTWIIQFIYSRCLPLVEYNDRTFTSQGKWFISERKVRGANSVIEVLLYMYNIYDYYHITDRN